MLAVCSVQRLVAACAGLAVTTLLGCALQSARGPAVPDFGVVDKVTIGGAGGWDFVTFDASHQRLFISRSDRVQVWGAQSKRIEAEIGGTSGVHGVALADDLQLGFTSNGLANTVSVFRLGD